MAQRLLLHLQGHFMQEPPERMERILCATDLSAPAGDAVALAFDVARVQQARILLVHVVAEPGGEGPAPLTLQAEDRCVELARLVAVARTRGIEADLVVFRAPDVAAAILDQAVSWPASLVVMGTQGGRGRREWGLGTVTERVLRRAPCPVLMAASAGFAQPASGASPLQRILCPTDFSDASRRAFEWGALMAGAFAARITTLHVLEWFPEGGERSQLRVPDYHMDLSQDARERLVRSIPARVRPFCADIPVVATGRPHREILRVAREREMGLIVLGVHDRRTLDQVLWGSTIWHVARETRCPVLAVRAREAAAPPAEPADRVHRAS